MNASQSLTLLACQIAVPAMTTAHERDAHLSASATKVRAALEDNNSTDLVVLPELSSIDYSRAAFDRLVDIAEPIDGASFQCWSAVARDCGVFISYSFARRDDAKCYIAIAVVGPDGELVGHYDKLHLAHYGASMEKDYFDRGGHLFTFKVRGFTIAPIICYDIRIPELTRALVVDHGADVILHCGAYYRDASFHTWHSFAVARAVENQVFFLSLNRAGRNFGNSVLCWPWLDENTAPVSFCEHDEDFKTLYLERSRLDAASRDYSFLNDRLDSYRLPLHTG